MTEKEAKTKWCPFARPAMVNTEHGRDDIYVPMGRHAVHNGARLIGVEDHCIGSQCMAWRWSSGPIKAGETFMERTGVSLKGNSFAVRTTETDIPGSGYCGLADKP